MFAANLTGMPADTQHNPKYPCAESDGVSERRQKLIKHILRLSALYEVPGMLCAETLAPLSFIDKAYRAW